MHEQAHGVSLARERPGAAERHRARGHPLDERAGSSWTTQLAAPVAGTRERKRAATLEEIERDHILSVLESVGWRVSGERGAASILGLKRTTLEARMSKLGAHLIPGLAPANRAARAARNDRRRDAAPTKQLVSEVFAPDVSLALPWHERCLMATRWTMRHQCQTLTTIEKEKTMKKLMLTACALFTLASPITTTTHAALIEGATRRM